MPPPFPLCASLSFQIIVVISTRVIFSRSTLIKTVPLPWYLLCTSVLQVRNRRLREGMWLLRVPYPQCTLSMYSAYCLLISNNYWVSRCQLIWSPSFHPELRLRNEGATIFPCHFLCDIKLVSANSHLLHFSYFFTYVSFPQDFYNMFKLKLWHCFLIRQSRISFKIGHKDQAMTSAWDGLYQVRPFSKEKLTCWFHYFGE